MRLTVAREMVKVLAIWPRLCPWARCWSTASLSIPNGRRPDVTPLQLGQAHSGAYPFDDQVPLQFGDRADDGGRKGLLLWSPRAVFRAKRRRARLHDLTHDKVDYQESFFVGARSRTIPLSPITAYSIARARSAGRWGRGFRDRRWLSSSSTSRLWRTGLQAGPVPIHDVKPAAARIPHQFVKTGFTS
jgi:hypothetical protein